MQDISKYLSFLHYFYVLLKAILNNVHAKWTDLSLIFFVYLIWYIEFICIALSNLYCKIQIKIKVWALHIGQALILNKWLQIYKFVYYLLD